MILLVTRDFRAAQTSGTLDFYTLRTVFHATADGLFHSSPERNTLFKLRRNILGHQLRVQIGALDFNNIHHNILAGEL